jgi:predicted metal-binding membrane protein
MMTFSYNPAALSLFVIIWTAGMAAMMFPAIVPMILFYNRLIDSSKGTGSNTPPRNTSQILYHGQDDTHSDDKNNINKNVDSEPSSLNQDQNKRKKPYNLSYVLRPKTYYLMIFILSYLAIWALTGVVLLVGWSFLFDTLLQQLEVNNNHQLQLLSTNTIYGIVLIVAGIYQFSSLKTKCLGYCESPLSFFMRKWRKGGTGAVKMGMYHGLYCLGCCWPYFLLMVALGWMNVLWMGLFAAIIFAEKVWTRRGLWIARITGIGFILLGILSAAALISLPSDSMNGSNDSEMTGMSMDMSLSPSGNMTGMSMDMSLSPVGFLVLFLHVVH